METNQNMIATGTGKKKISLTPRELINYHIENPEEPITDEDILNLKLDHQIEARLDSRDFRLKEQV